nr:MAG TPA: hypothetical protein [Bacteriophage sp.]
MSSTKCLFLRISVQLRIVKSLTIFYHNFIIH